MNGSYAHSLGPSSRYAVLANNVSIVLSRLGSEQIGEAEQRLMERAANLLRNIVQGSKFVELRDARALSNPSENLFTVGHAIQALQILAAKDQKLEQITNIFEDYEQQLRRLSHGDSVNKEQVDAIVRFFDTLGSLFYRDVAESAAPRRQPLFQIPEPEDL